MSKTVPEEKIRSHPDYPAEQKHLEQTIMAIRSELAELDREAAAELRQAREEARRQESSDNEVYVRTSLASLKSRKIKRLTDALESPYFGRIDFSDDKLRKRETYYFGRTGIGPTDGIQVIDWRAPIASLFYESRGGRAGYLANGRLFSGTVHLKRQYRINHGELQYFSDDPLTEELTELAPQHEQLLADPYLIQQLQQRSGGLLKEIVETIRAEQNRIIRQPMEQVTIVQGAAGSGKSTVALHRISYLLYSHRNLKPEEIAIIAPNRIFLSYIADALPGFEVEGIYQATFKELAAGIIKTDCRLTAHNLRYKGSHPGAASVLRKAEQVKGTMAFLRAIDSYLAQWQANFTSSLPSAQFFQGRYTLGRGELAAHFNRSKLPLNKRLKSLRDYCNNGVTAAARRISDELSGGSLRQMTLDFAAEPPASSTGQYLGNKNSNSPEIDNIMAERNLALRYYNSLWKPLDYLQVYRELLASISSRPAGGQESLVSAAKITARRLKHGLIAPSDLAPLCYLRYLIDGFDDLPRYRHIIVDEGQDLSAADYMILKLLCRTKEPSLTILGDLAQNIDNTGINNWKYLQRSVFWRSEHHLFRIDQSYRSTREIVQFAARVLPASLPRPVPLLRAGEPPTIEHTASWEETADRVWQQLVRYQEAGLDSIAIIHKEEEECRSIFALLQSSLDPGLTLTLIDNERSCYGGSVTLLPIALAKGLEFDAVIIWDASEDYFSSSDTDAKLLYVALTRSLHQLQLYYTGRISPLLRDVRGSR